MPVTTENVQVVGSKKVRIYPKHQDKYFCLLSQSRRSYNLAIEWLKKQNRVDLGQKTEVRQDIREQVREEWKDRIFSSDLSDLSVDEAFDTFTKCVRKWSKSQKAEMHFRSRKDASQSFMVRRLPVGGIYPRSLGEVHITEEIPKEAIGSMASVTRSHGRWYLQVKQYVTVRKRENQARTVALDPGVRTFMAALSPSEAVKFGDDFAAARIFPLLRKKDTLLGKRKRLLNKKCDRQWWRDQMHGVNKRLDRLSARVNDLVGDLHRRVVFDLVSRYDTIICPPFETSNMVIKDGRKLRRSSVRQMQSLSHYEFQLRLKWGCRRYGNIFVSCSEAYTSKTRSWDGMVEGGLGSSTTIGDGAIVVDRDFNGARGVFLLAHTR